MATIKQIQAHVDTSSDANELTYRDVVCVKCRYCSKVIWLRIDESVYATKWVNWEPLWDNEWDGDYSAQCPDCRMAMSLPTFDRQSLVEVIMDQLDTTRLEGMVDTIVSSINEIKHEEVMTEFRASIQGDLNRLVNTITDRVLSVAERWEQSQPEEIVLLPENCRFFYRKNGFTLFATEQSPITRTVKYVGATYRVALPYVVFLFTVKGSIIESPRIAFRPAPLRKLDDMLYLPSLPNFKDGTLEPCLGVNWKGTYSSREDGVYRSMSVTDQIKDTIGHFWGSNFTHTWMENYDKYAKKHPDIFTSFDNWQTKSKTDPLFFLKLEMEPCHPLSTYVTNIANKSVPNLGEGLRTSLTKEVNEIVAKLVSKIEVYLGRSPELKITSGTTRTAVLAEVEDVVWDATNIALDRAEGYIDDMLALLPHADLDYGFDKKGW